MTAMIDVVFLLLIYFVCTASFAPAESDLRGEVSAAGEDAAPEPIDRDDPTRLVVSVSPADGPLVAGGIACDSLSRLAEVLASEAQKDASRTIVLDVDRAARLGRAIDVYDVCQLAKFRRVEFGVRRD